MRKRGGNGFDQPSVDQGRATTAVEAACTTHFQEAKHQHTERASHRTGDTRRHIHRLVDMAFVHRLSCEGVKSELDMFRLPTTQTLVVGGTPTAWGRDGRSSFCSRIRGRLYGLGQHVLVRTGTRRQRRRGEHRYG